MLVLVLLHSCFSGGFLLLPLLQLETPLAPAIVVAIAIGDTNQSSSLLLLSRRSCCCRGRAVGHHVKCLLRSQLKLPLHTAATTAAAAKGQGKERGFEPSGHVQSPQLLGRGFFALFDLRPHRHLPLPLEPPPPPPGQHRHAPRFVLELRRGQRGPRHPLQCRKTNRRQAHHCRRPRAPPQAPLGTQRNAQALLRFFLLLFILLLSFLRFRLFCRRLGECSTRSLFLRFLHG
mmetsp:Transcript_22298/g.43974  ORF Transcript_22298/g.43974 Transcript_22298/m.43974 type:complete len:232 (+) Transcript_22298:793-1488(+)